MTTLGRVMLIDDEEFDRMIYERIINRSGQAEDVVSFARAADALAYLLSPDSLPVHLILLDINMPGMSGFEFMDAAEAYIGGERSIPVIVMLTTSLAPSDKARAATYDAIAEYFNKPLCEEHLEKATAILERLAPIAKVS